MKSSEAAWSSVTRAYTMREFRDVLNLPDGERLVQVSVQFDEVKVTTIKEQS